MIREDSKYFTQEKCLNRPRRPHTQITLMTIPPLTGHDPFLIIYVPLMHKYYLKKSHCLSHLHQKVKANCYFTIATGLQSFQSCSKVNSAQKSRMSLYSIVLWFPVTGITGLNLSYLYNAPVHKESPWRNRLIGVGEWPSHVTLTPLRIFTRNWNADCVPSRNKTPVTKWTNHNNHS